MKTAVLGPDQPPGERLGSDSNRSLSVTGVEGVERLPYEHLNLRFNPFGEPTYDEWAQLAVVDAAPIQRGEIRQVLGRCGRGKTTYLLALRRRHPESRYVRVDPPPEKPQRLPPPRETPLLLLDEAQALKERVLKRALRRYETVVFTSHVDYTSLSPRPLETLRLAGLSQEKLALVIERRLQWARRGPGRIPQITKSTMDTLLRRWGDDLRAILDALYDAVQDLEEPCHVQM